MSDSYSQSLSALEEKVTASIAPHSSASSSGSAPTVSDPNIVVPPVTEAQNQQYQNDLRNSAWLDLLLYLFFAAATFLIYAQQALNVTSLASKTVFIAFSFAIALIELGRTYYHIKDFRGLKEGKPDASDYLKIAASILIFSLFLTSGITNWINLGGGAQEILDLMNSTIFPISFIGISSMLLIVQLQNYSKSKQKGPGYLFAAFICVAISLMSLGLIPGAIYGLPSLWIGVGTAMVALGAVSVFQNRNFFITTPATSTLQQSAAIEEEDEHKQLLVDRKAIASDEPKATTPPPRTKTRAWLDFFSAITFAAVAFILYARIPLGITNEWCTGFLAAISGLQVIVEAWRIGYNIRDMRREKAKGEEGNWSIFITKVIPSLLLVVLSTWVVYSRAFELAGSSSILGFGGTAAAMNFSITWLFPIGYSCVSPFLLIGAIKEYWNKEPRQTQDLIKPFIFLALSILSTGLVAGAYFSGLPDLWVAVGLVVAAIGAASLYLDWDVINGNPPQNKEVGNSLTADQQAHTQALTQQQEEKLALLNSSNALSDSASLASTASASSTGQPTFSVLLDHGSSSSLSASATTSSNSMGSSDPESASTMRHRTNTNPPNVVATDRSASIASSTSDSSSVQHKIS